jgi:outer membrane protein TolC
MVRVPNRYQGGVDTYLQAVVSQATAFNSERNDIDIMRRQLEASMLLVKALGGNWNRSQLPKVQARPLLRIYSHWE